jgi:competence protein ComEC
MFAAALSFLSGNLLLQQFSQLPGWQLPLWSILLLPLLMLFPLRKRYLRVLVWMVAGLLFSLYFAQQRLAERLPVELAGVDVNIVGTVASIPQTGEGAELRFRFAVESAQYQGEDRALPRLIRLNWYHHKGAPPQAGEQWQLKVRLKPPHGSFNPGGFDYEKWLFQEGIGATGYVRQSKDNFRLLEAAPYSLSAIRSAIYHQLLQLIDAEDERGVLIALALGERSDISSAQWNLFFNTGTNHLVAISGLHIGLVAGLIFLLVRWGWGWLPLRWSNYTAAPRVAALCAMLAALIYAALAGFSIPTQRALLMLLIAFGAIILQRPVRPLQLLSFALLMVLLLDPFASMSVGFWLSFAAVALIFTGAGSGGNRAPERLLVRYGKLQWLLFLGLAPLLILFFGRVSLVAPIANLIAVPWVSLWVVPLTLISVVALPFSTVVAEMMLVLAAVGMAGLTYLLSWLDAFAAPLTLIPASDWLLIPAAAGLAVMLFYRRGRLWQRLSGLLGLLPLLLITPAAPEEGEARVTLLDVGQGLSVVVESRDHTLVFDTGASFRSGFNFGEAAVLPYLRSRGIAHIDTLIVSHGDNDHIGGARSLSEQIEITRVLSSVPQMMSWAAVEACHAGERWRWNGVEFRMLHPESLTLPLSENDLSCVLQITTMGQTLLLTGDIEATAERLLVAQYGEQLRSDILVAPHHGSKTSSSQSFVDNVSPQWVLFPVGYRNRYGFPHASVISRYRTLGARALNSFSAGAISFNLCDQCPLEPQSYRQQGRRYWHNIEYD